MCESTKRDGDCFVPFDRIAQHSDEENRPMRDASDYRTVAMADAKRPSSHIVVDKAVVVQRLVDHVAHLRKIQIESQTVGTAQRNRVSSGDEANSAQTVSWCEETNSCLTNDACVPFLAFSVAQRDRVAVERHRARQKLHCLGGRRTVTTIDALCGL